MTIKEIRSMNPANISYINDLSIQTLLGKKVKTDSLDEIKRGRFLWRNRQNS